MPKANPPKWQVKDYSHLDGKEMVYQCYNSEGFVETHKALVVAVNYSIGITIVKKDDPKYILFCLSFIDSKAYEIEFLILLRAISKGLLFADSWDEKIHEIFGDIFEPFVHPESVPSEHCPYSQ